MSASIFHNNLYPLLIASVINQKVKQQNVDGRVVEIEASEFCDSFNTLLGAYTTKYGYKPNALGITRKKVKEIVESGDFLKFVKYANDKLIIDVVAEKYETSISKVIVAASWEYSKILVKSINDLSALYRNVTSQEKELKESKEAEEMKEVDDILDVSSVSSLDSNVSDLEEDEKEEEAEEKKEEAEEKEEEAESEESKEMLDIPDAEPDQIDTKEEKKAEEAEEAEEEKELKEAEEEEEAKTESKAKVDAESDSSVLSSDSSSDSEDEAIEEEPSPEMETTTLQKTKDEPDVVETRKRQASSSLASLQQRKRFQHIAVNLIDSIHTHRYSSPFLNPVNKKEALDYSDIIYQPKDLKNILRGIKLKADPPEYLTIKELERDIMLMFANCVMYNRSDTDLVELTRSMKDDVRASFKLFEDTEAEMK